MAIHWGEAAAVGDAAAVEGGAAGPGAADAAAADRPNPNEVIRKLFSAATKSRVHAYSCLEKLKQYFNAILFHFSTVSDDLLAG